MNPIDFYSIILFMEVNWSPTFFQISSLCSAEERNSGLEQSESE